MPQKEAGAAGSQGAMQWVKNRNNIMENYLRKEVEAYRRQKDINVSQIDQDRLDIHDFLKALKKCDSDFTPEAKIWLGEKLPSGRRKEPMKRVSTAPAKIVKQEAQAEREVKTALEQHAPDELAKYDFRFRARETPELVRRSTTMCGIFNRRNELVGKNSTAPPSEHNGNQSQTRPTSVTFRESTAKPCSAYSRDVGSAFDGRLDEETAVKRSAGRSRNVHHADEESDFMKQFLMRKYHHRRKPRKPLNERIEEFLKELDVVKREDEDFNKQPEEWQKSRRWKVITHGVKAALADSSDEEDASPDHTC